ncbi:hypothetical protein F442_21791 [Phytophthora nicotianae P10297]|uniref:Uncharacterized protein n=1 Tax=Phytophthora nicotianae P10297 TaxID=1317064 RepID=W2Y1J8_PHYNI|nr:hypothetical protein F442_21791 [Phytophthora nicotianae P10297]
MENGNSANERNEAGTATSPAKRRSDATRLAQYWTGDTMAQQQEETSTTSPSWTSGTRYARDG